MSEPASGPGTLPPLPYPSDRAAIAESFRQPLGRLWLRILARLMEWLTDLQPKQLNYSDVTPQLAVGGAFKTRQVKRLRQRGITAVVDCRLEAHDNAEALKQAGIEFLHLPTLDRYGFTFEQMRQGVEWVLAHLEGGGRAFLHCEHGVGRGPLMTCAVLVGQGYGAPEALRMVRAARWQALPNDRQLAALLGFEQAWRQQRSERIVDDASTLDDAPNAARLPQSAHIPDDIPST